MYAILIGKKADGTKCAVSDVLKMSAAKAKFDSFESEDLVMVELYPIRNRRKRRRLNRSVILPPAEEEADEPPTFDEIVEQLAADREIIPAEGYGQDGRPTVKGIESVFGVEIDAGIRDDIWAKVLELESD